MLNQLLDGRRLEYDIYLCRTGDRKQIGKLNAYNKQYYPKLKEPDELSFTINYFNNDLERTKNIYYDLVKGDSVIYLVIRDNDTVLKTQYFIVQPPQESGVELDKKEVLCYSYEYILNNAKVRSFKDFRKLYDNVHNWNPNDYTKGGILNYIKEKELYNSWAITYVNPTLLNQYRDFDISGSVMDINKYIEKEFNCIFIYETVSQSISIKLNDEIGVNKGFHISENNLLKNIKKEEKTNEMTTKLRVFGNNNISINKYNITGQNYIINIDYYLNTEYMEQSLIDKWNAYKTVLSNNAGTFNTYLTQLNGYETTLATKQNELVALKEQLKVIEDNEDIAIRDGVTPDGHDYSYWHTQYENKQSEINTKNTEINTVNTQINSVNTNIVTLNNTVSLESNFQSYELKKLVTFFKTEEITLDSIGDEETLYELCQIYLEKASVPTIDYQIEIPDIFNINDFQYSWIKLVEGIGDYINVSYERMNLKFIPFRLVAYSHNIDSNSLTIYLNNKDRINTDDLYYYDIQKTVKKSSDILTNEKPDYQQYTEDKDNILTNTSTIDTANNIIQSNGGVVIDRRGQYMRDNDSANGQMRILGDRIIFTQDNWNTTSVGISSGGIVTNSLFTLTNSGGSVEINGDRLVVTNMDLELIKYDNSNPVEPVPLRRIIMNPSEGFRIQKYITTNLWDDQFFVDEDGYLIAKNLRTDASANGAFVELQEQYLKFYNGSSAKMVFGLENSAGSIVPSITLGAGDGSGNNQGLVRKNSNNLTMSYKTSNGKAILNSMINNDSTYTGGRLQLGSVYGDCHIELLGVVDLNVTNKFILYNCTLSSLPSSPVEGQLVYDTVNNIPLIYGFGYWRDTSGNPLVPA